MHRRNNSSKAGLLKQPAIQITLQNYSSDELYQLAERQYKKVSSGQQNRWHDIISRGGTKKDKIGLLATEILRNPHTSLQQFQQLVRQCFDKNHHQAVASCQALTNIYNEYVFSEKGRLSSFFDSVKGKGSKKSQTMNIAELVGMYIEHHLKHFYAELIKSIEILLQSTIVYAKKAAISMLALQTKHEELRRMIISILINKFGDTDSQVVNATSKSLKEEFYQDLQSSSIFLEEAESFLLRENASRKSQFYVINYLNNLNMKLLNEKALSKLFQIFYHFFQLLMGEQSKEGTVSSRLFLNSIKGLNKIFGFIKGGNKETKQLIESKIEKVYKIVHQTVNVKAKVQLFLLLFQYHSYLHGLITDRFYRALYQFLGHDQMLHCSLTEVFFDLLLVSLKQDENINRVLAFLKRILQLCMTAQANFIVTSLILIGKIFENKQGLKVMVRQAENVMEEEEERGKKYDMTKREPLYAGAEHSLLWELAVFTIHPHPTIRKYALALTKGEEIPYEGTNPLSEFSSTTFLEKLILKKDKKSEAWRFKMKKNLSKIRKSKYENLIELIQEGRKEDEAYIQKYLKQRSQIHSNFRNKHPTDIDEFADEVIEKQMKRLNPNDPELSEGSIEEEQVSENSQNVYQSEHQSNLEGQNQNDFENQSNSSQSLDDLEGQGSQESNADEEQDGEKQWQEVFNEIRDSQNEHKGQQKQRASWRTKNIRKSQNRGKAGKQRKRQFKR